MNYQAKDSYEADLIEEVERQCDAIASELCDEAQEAGLPFPYVIKFLDECGAFVALTVNEDDENWQWLDPIKNGQWQFEGERLIAVLRSGARMPLRRFFKLRWASEDAE